MLNLSFRTTANSDVSVDGHCGVLLISNEVQFFTILIQRETCPTYIRRTGPTSNVGFCTNL